MNTLAENPIKSIALTIRKALQAGISYLEYRELVKQLALENSNSGPEKTAALANYTQLNDRRMNRWDKTLKIEEEVVNGFKEIKQKMIWLVITESWCGDASPSLPVINKLASLSPNISLKIVFRDEHPALMDLFLTNGARSIPKLIVLDAGSMEVLAEWGPRSSKATKMVNDYKAEHGQLTPEFKQDLQVFYNKDKGQNIVEDLRQLLALK